MRRTKRLLLSFLNGLGWTGFGWVVLKTGYYHFWIGYWAFVCGFSAMVLAFDKMLEPRKWWRR